MPDVSSKFRFEARAGYVLCAVTEIIESQEDIQLLHQVMMDNLMEHESNRLLLDERIVASHVTYHDVVLAIRDEVTTYFATHGVRIVSVVPPERLESKRAYETMALNRSINYRAFIDMGEATSWLLA